MNFLKSLGDSLSGEWWKGLAVIVTFVGIVLGSILTFAIFRLTESNLELAESNLEESRQQHTARVEVAGEAYIPLGEDAPQFEDRWDVRLTIVNYGPVRAGGFEILTDGFWPMDLDPNSIRLYDSWLNEIPNGLFATVDTHWGDFRIMVTILETGQRLEIVAKGDPGIQLVKFAEELYYEGWLYEAGSPESDLYHTSFVPSGSAHSVILDVCVFKNMVVSGEDIRGVFFPVYGEDPVDRERLMSSCPW